VVSKSNYCYLAREAKVNFAGTQYELKNKHSELILMVVQSVKNIEIRKELESQMEITPEEWKNINCCYSTDFSRRKRCGKIV